MSIAAARKAKGWSQEDLARSVGLTSKSYMCEIEGGKLPSLRVAVGIYRELGVRTAPIADLSEDEIAILQKTFPKAA